MLPSSFALPSSASRAGRRLLAAAAGVLALGAAATGSAERLVESIAAQVGNEIILASEVLELTAPIEERMRQAGAPPAEVAMVRREALERLIETKLISSVVERLELGADREEIDRAIDAIADENGLTREQLLASIENHGLTIDEYREKIRGEIERSKVVGAMVRSRVQISDEEVRAAYEEQFGAQRAGGEEIHVRHILVLTQGDPPRSAEAACQIAGEARDRIVGDGVDFRDVAAQVSDMNPDRGGDLGWMHREDLAGWKAETIGALEPGQVSSVVRMPFGCNLLQLVDRRGYRPVDFTTAEPRLREIIYQQKTEVEYTKWLDVLRGQTYIERKGSFSAGALGG